MQSLLRVSPTGQVTLPRPIRQRLGLDSGGYLGLEVNDSTLVLRRVQIVPADQASRTGHTDTKEGIEEE